MLQELRLILRAIGDFFHKLSGSGMTYDGVCNVAVMWEWRYWVAKNQILVLERELVRSSGNQEFLLDRLSEHTEAGPLRDLVRKVSDEETGEQEPALPKRRILGP